jgi:hypothetical protein
MEYEFNPPNDLRVAQTRLEGQEQAIANLEVEQQRCLTVMTALMERLEHCKRYREDLAQWILGYTPAAQRYPDSVVKLAMALVTNNGSNPGDIKLKSCMGAHVTNIQYSLAIDEPRWYPLFMLEHLREAGWTVEPPEAE